MNTRFLFDDYFCMSSHKVCSFLLCQSVVRDIIDLHALSHTDDIVSLKGSLRNLDIPDEAIVNLDSLCAILSSALDVVEHQCGQSVHGADVWLSSDVHIITVEDDGSNDSVRRYRRVEQKPNVDVLEFDGGGLVSFERADGIDNMSFSAAAIFCKLTKLKQI